MQLTVIINIDGLFFSSSLGKFTLLQLGGDFNRVCLVVRGGCLSLLAVTLDLLALSEELAAAGGRQGVQTRAVVLQFPSFVFCFCFLTASILVASHDICSMTLPITRLVHDDILVPML